MALRLPPSISTPQAILATSSQKLRECSPLKFGVSLSKDVVTQSRIKILNPSQTPRFTGDDEAPTTSQDIQSLFVQALHECGESGNLRLLDTLKRLHTKYQQSLLEQNRQIFDLRQRLHVDFLTGLYNRSFYESRLDEAYQEAVSQNKPLTVMMIDLDRFKAINDTFGHDVGDIALKQFSDALINAVGEKGYACRLGGDEFAVILPKTGTKTARIVAEDIRNLVRNASFETEYQGQARKIRLGSSIGICVMNDNPFHQEISLKTYSTLLTETADLTDTVTKAADLTKIADQVMYAVKSSARKASPPSRHPIGILPVSDNPQSTRSLAPDIRHTIAD